MLYSGDDPEMYVTEYALVYEEYVLGPGRGGQSGPLRVVH